MNKENLEYELIRLVNIMEKLRGTDGCPWDKKQTLDSLKPYIVEEAYEVVEALQKNDMDLLKEELGDVLLQIVFQAQVAREEEIFDLVDVFRGISDKLIRRHPHVFSDKEAVTPEDVSILWNKVKESEKKVKGKESEEISILDNLATGQPALNQAAEVQKKAAEVGFDWVNIRDVLDKVREEVDEVEEAINNDDLEDASLEIGDLLFSVVNLSRFLNTNPEIALLATILKFKNRFQYIESIAKNEGNLLEDMTLEEMDYYWEEAKTCTKESGSHIE
ncbi:MAG: nucleoside triphosphate pyrophosphohydrolase [Halanaerobiales bacterium]